MSFEEWWFNFMRVHPLRGDPSDKHLFRECWEGAYKTGIKDADEYPYSERPNGWPDGPKTVMPNGFSD